MFYVCSLCVTAKLPVGGKTALASLQLTLLSLSPVSQEAEVPTGCHGLTWRYGVETGASGCSPPGPCRAGGDRQTHSMLPSTG